MAQQGGARGRKPSPWHEATAALMLAIAAVDPEAAPHRGSYTLEELTQLLADRAPVAADSPRYPALDALKTAQGDALLRGRGALRVTLSKVHEVVVDRIDEKGFCWAHQRRIAADAHVEVRTVRRGTQALERAGALFRVSRVAREMRDGWSEEPRSTVYVAPRRPVDPDAVHAAWCRILWGFDGAGDERVDERVDAPPAVEAPPPASAPAPRAHRAPAAAASSPPAPSTRAQAWLTEAARAELAGPCAALAAAAGGAVAVTLDRIAAIAATIEEDLGGAIAPAVLARALVQARAAVLAGEYPPRQALVPVWRFARTLARAAGAPQAPPAATSARPVGSSGPEQGEASEAAPLDRAQRIAAAAEAQGKLRAIFPDYQPPAYARAPERDPDAQPIPRARALVAQLFGTSAPPRDPTSTPATRAAADEAALEAERARRRRELAAALGLSEAELDAEHERWRDQHRAADTDGPDPPDERGPPPSA